MPETDAAPEAIASPIDLLFAEQEARDVLVLSYTLNLNFWERYALSLARGLGALVTVVGDAAMVAGDPAHVRYAGITYLDGRAACRANGAFHPKLVVIAGDDYATIAVGSGNATLPGWHSNAELWSVIRGDRDSAPTTFHELARWLQGLEREVRFGPGVPEALNRVADRLLELPANETGPRLISSLDGPILDRLPAGATDELTVAAPFHDHSNSAIAALVERLRPTSLRVVLQPREVVANGPGLSSFLKSAGGEALTIAGERYHHGKLYEWVRDGRRYALTGSPNLSGRAFTLAMADGGNCELALLTEIADTIAPATGEPLGLELVAITIEPREPAAPAIALLGVSWQADGNGIELALAAGLPERGALEALINDVWQVVAPIPESVDRVPILGLFDIGTAVRVRIGDLTSNVCFITDLSRVKRARVAHTGRVRTDEVDIFGDAKTAEAFAFDLAELRAALDRARAAAGGRPPGGPTGSTGHIAFESWEAYLDRCASLIGERLLAYGLALPHLGQGDIDIEDPGEDPGGEDDGDPYPPVPPLPGFDDRPQRERRRYQRWCERLAELSPELPPPARLVALRLMLRAVAGGLFEDEETWVPLVAEATHAATTIADDVFSEEQRAAASLGAVALTVIRGHIPNFHRWGPLRAHYERAATALDPLLPCVDADRVDRLTGELKAAFPALATPGAVQRLVEARLRHDALDDAMHAAEDELSLDFERTGSLLLVRGSVGGDPRRLLLRIVALAEKTEVAVRAPTANGEAVAAWSRPNLVLVRPTPLGVIGALYLLRGFGPSAYFDIAELPKPHASWSRRGDEPTVVKAIYARLGVE